jgi:hypothetical protein
MFDFEDLVMDVSCGGGSTSPSWPDQPRGTLFESLPSLVVSEATGGWVKDRVRLCLISHVDEVCGGETKGGGAVVRFCSKPWDACEVASHAKSKASPTRLLAPMRPQERRQPSQTGTISSSCESRATNRSARNVAP